MARPPRVERLRHGRLLSGSVFRFFVETWNWIVGYVDNMRGDADVNPQNGHITIDRSDPDNPVIRFRADKLQPGGGAIDVDGVVVMSIDYVDSDTDEDFEDHPYQIRARRGRLVYAPETGALSVVEDASLKQFVNTVELSSYFAS